MVKKKAGSHIFMPLGVQESVKERTLTLPSELPCFLSRRWRVTYHWKVLNEGYNFAIDLISIGGLKTKLWGP